MHMLSHIYVVSDDRAAQDGKRKGRTSPLDLRACLGVHKQKAHVDAVLEDAHGIEAAQGQEEGPIEPPVSRRGAVVDPT
jgi:hypothetical protein